MVDDEFITGPSAEVLRNPLTAAQRLLTENGFTVVTNKDRRILSQLSIKNNHILWLKNLNFLVSEKEFQHVFNWVQSGGHLLAGVSESMLDEPTLMSRYLHEINIEFIDSDNELLLSYYESDSTDSIVHIRTLDNAQKNIQVDLGYDPSLSAGHGSRLRVGPAVDLYSLVQQDHGAGLITLYTDNEAFDYDRIDYEDQAYLLLWLLRGTIGNVQIMASPNNSPGLFRTLWLKGSLIIIALAITVAGFLRYAATRLGPIELEPSPGRSNLLAHLKARGEFWRRHNSLDSMLRPVRQSVLTELHRRRGGVMQELDAIDDSVFAQTAELADCSLADAKLALTGPVKTDSELLHISSILYRVLNKTHRRSAATH